MKTYFFTVVEGENIEYIAFDMGHGIPFTTEYPMQGVFMSSYDGAEEILFHEKNMKPVLMSDGNYIIPAAIRRVAGIYNAKKSAKITITLNSLELNVNGDKLEKIKTYEIHMEEYNDGCKPKVSLVTYHH